MNVILILKYWAIYFFQSRITEPVKTKLMNILIYLVDLRIWFGILN